MTHKNAFEEVKLFKRVYFFSLLFLAFPHEGTTQILNIASWGGQYQASQQRAYVDPYIEMNPAVRIETDEIGPEAVSKLRAFSAAGIQTYDLVDVLAEDGIRLCDEGLAMEVDFDEVLAIGDDGSRASDDFGRFLINDCLIPQIAYSIAVGYRTDMMPSDVPPPSSICDMFDVETYPGKRALEKGPIINMEWALLCDGVAKEDIYDVLATEEGKERARAKLGSIKENTIWWTASAMTPQWLAEGEVVMGSTYNSRLFSLIEEQGAPVEILWDAQVLDVEGWIIPVGLPDQRLALAEDFVKFATDSQRLADQASYLPFGPARSSSLPLVGAHAEFGIDMLQYMPTAPANMANVLMYNHEFWREHEAEANEQFNSWIAEGPANGKGGSRDDTSDPAEKAKVHVMFGTTRQYHPSRETYLKLESTQYSGLSYGTMEVLVPDTHVIGNVDNELSFFETFLFPDFTDKFEIESVTHLSAEQFKKRLGQGAAATDRTAFVYIHGFATTFEYAAQRTAQLAFDLQPYRGAPVFFSWPSKGKRNRQSYQADEQMIEQNRKVLADFLITLIELEELDTVHLIAHSLGTRLLARSLEEVSHRDPDYLDKIGEIVLAAPDIGVGPFAANFEELFSSAPPRTTIYASRDDWALSVSRRWHGNGDGAYRVGEIYDNMTLFPSIDLIDISGLSGSFEGHSVVAQNPAVISDLFNIYEHGLRPSQRCCLRAQRSGGASYYRLVSR